MKKRDCIVDEKAGGRFINNLAVASRNYCALHAGCKPSLSPLPEFFFFIFLGVTMVVPLFGLQLSLLSTAAGI